MALAEWRYQCVPVYSKGTLTHTVVEQWWPSVPHPPRVFIERLDDGPDYNVVTRSENATLITGAKGRVVSGPFPDLASAQAAFEILSAFGALDSYAYPP